MALTIQEFYKCACIFNITDGFPSLEEAILGSFRLDETAEKIVEAVSVPVLTSEAPHGFGTGDMIILKNSGSDTNGS